MIYFISATFILNKEMTKCLHFIGDNECDVEIIGVLFMKSLEF